MTMPSAANGREMPLRAEVTPETLKSVAKIAGGVFYQPPRGRPQVLISSEELDELRVTQDYWINEQRRRHGVAGPF